MNTICLSLVFVCSLAFSVFTCLEGKRIPECSTCKEIVDNFHKGLSKTEKSNYGGGNSHWEENSLKKPFAISEMRLVEIMEQLCKDKSSECHPMLEENEEVIEHFWNHHFAQKSDKDFHTFFCIENVKACCPDNTFGKDCNPCPGGVIRPCLGHGNCDGAGTRKGTGQCRCHSGYTGELCDNCKEGFYQYSKNDTDIECKVCHIACQGGCSGGDAKSCTKCKDGWLTDAEEGCQDIDECKEDPCEDSEYCTNTQGSYSCMACDTSCVSCTGSGPGKCNHCKDGYDKLSDGKCEDKDECQSDPSLCLKDNEECVNTPGSFQCICATGFEYNKDKECVKTSKARDRVVKTEEIKMTESLKKKFAAQHPPVDWSKFKDTPSVVNHFLVLGCFGVMSHFAAKNYLALFALSLLAVVHVVWFASHCR